MDPASPENYWSFVASRWCPTELCEFRREQTLLAVAVIDRLDQDVEACPRRLFRCQAKIGKKRLAGRRLGDAGRHPARHGVNRARADNAPVVEGLVERGLKPRFRPRHGAKAELAP